MTLSAAEAAVRVEVSRLAARNEIVLLGVVRQEMLSGLFAPARFEQSRAALRAFPDEATRIADHERAAEMFTICRAAGIQGSIVDYLLCAVAERLELSILTTDTDFTHYAQHLPIRLHLVAEAEDSP